MDETFTVRNNVFSFLSDFQARFGQKEGGFQIVSEQDWGDGSDHVNYTCPIRETGQTRRRHKVPTNPNLKLILTSYMKDLIGASTQGGLNVLADLRKAKKEVERLTKANAKLKKENWDLRKYK